MVSGVLLWVYFAIGLVVPEPTLCYFLSSGIDILSSCQNPRIGSLTCVWSKGYHGRESHM